MKLLVTLLYALTLCEAFAQPDKGRPLYEAGDMDHDVCLVLSRGDSTSYVSCMAICLASFGLVGFELGQIHRDLQLWEVCGLVYGAQCLCHGNNTLPKYIIMSRALQDQGLAHHDCVEGRSSQSCNTLGTENSVSEPFKVGVSVSKACASMVAAVNSNNQ